MYPEYLLPKAYYHIIQAKHFAENEDLVLIRHIESSEVKYMEGTSILHPEFVSNSKVITFVTCPQTYLEYLPIPTFFMAFKRNHATNYVLYGMKGVMLEKYSQRNFSKTKVDKLTLSL